MRHSIQAIFWKVLQVVEFRELISQFYQKPTLKRRMRKIYRSIILRLNNKLKQAADSKIKQGDCKCPYVIPGNRKSSSKKFKKDLANENNTSLSTTNFQPDLYTITCAIIKLSFTVRDAKRHAGKKPLLTGCI